MASTVDLTRTTEYRDLLLTLEPRTIASEEQADTYRGAIDVLTNCRHMSEGQREMVGLLGQLVYEWESEREAPITADPTQVVATLLEANGLSQTALVGPVFPNRQVASATLSGHRRITYERAVKLGKFFHISPSAFYAPPEQSASEKEQSTGTRSTRSQRDTVEETVQSSETVTSPESASSNVSSDD